MIRTKVPDSRLFYGSEELYRPPGTNFYARVNAVICQACGSWRALCVSLRCKFSGAENGRPVDPVVYFKAFLVAYIENIVYDTDLAERIGDSLAIREFLGYAPPSGPRTIQAFRGCVRVYPKTGCWRKCWTGWSACASRRG